MSVWLWTGVLSDIIQGPLNTLVVRCVDEYANMSCVSNDTTGPNPGENTIAWTYDGNTVINSPCQSHTSVFSGSAKSNTDCNIAASLREARSVTFIRTISGPYACLDQTSHGIAFTLMAIVLGTCIVLSSYLVPNISLKLLCISVAPE